MALLLVSQLAAPLSMAEHDMVRLDGRAACVVDVYSHSHINHFGLDVFDRRGGGYEMVTDEAIDGVARDAVNLVERGAACCKASECCGTAGAQSNARDDCPSKVRRSFWRSGGPPPKPPMSARQSYCCAGFEFGSETLADGTRFCLPTSWSGPCHPDNATWYDRPRGQSHGTSAASTAPEASAVLLTTGARSGGGACCARVLTPKQLAELQGVEAGGDDVDGRPGREGYPGLARRGTGIAGQGAVGMSAPGGVSAPFPGWAAGSSGGAQHLCIEATWKVSEDGELAWDCKPWGYDKAQHDTHTGTGSE